MHVHIDKITTGPVLARKLIEHLDAYIYCTCTSEPTAEFEY